MVSRFFSSPAHIDNDAAGIHHDEAVAKTQGIPHIVRNHEACQMVPGNDFLRQGNDLFGRFWSRAAVCSSRRSNLGWFMAAIRSVRACAVRRKAVPPEQSGGLQVLGPVPLTVP